MKHKNILLFIIDSLNNTRIRQYGEVLMPTFTSLKKEYCYCDSMYSQAPYTEAALMNLYCGQDVLQNNGYMFRFKDAPINIFELMKDKGYTTFFNSYQPQCYPSSLRRGVDDIYYNVGFDIGAFWSYRLSHYSELKKINALNEKDYCTLSELLKDNFIEWIVFLDALINKDSSINMIYGNAGNYDAISVKEQVVLQQSFFNSNERAYIDDVLTKGLEHNLFNIPAYNQTTKIKNRERVEKNSKRLMSLYRTIWWKNLRRNITSTPKLLSIILKSFINYVKRPTPINKKDFLKAAYYSLNHLIDFDLKERNNKNYDWFKNAPSARTHLDHFFKWADNYNSEKPFFACVHVDDVHNPEVFLTYDSEDDTVLEKEISIANNTLSKIPSKSKGSVTHDLSLSYIDDVIKYLVDKMSQKEYGANTSIVICADHGFSFSGDPIRESYVTNLYLENYNMPFLVIDESLKHIEIKGFRESKDIPGFIEAMADDSVEALNKLPEYSFATIEYCGGGCPDLTRRELKIAAFNDKLFVGTLCKLDSAIGCEQITEIYDLVKDKDQLHNMASNHNYNEHVKALLSVIEKRRADIKESMS